MKTEPHARFTVGTLSYDKKGLWMLFFWLMWNDFSITLLEQITTLTSIQMRDRGATYTMLATFGTIGGLMGMWINPVFSTWSDRMRSRFGRRRPFLLIATPLFAASMCTIPFMPDLYQYLVKQEGMAGLLGHIHINGEVLFIGIASIVTGLFNGVVLAIFTYYYWDVVPELVLGRFNSIAKIVTVAAGLVWNFAIIGYADTHLKVVYIGVGTFCLVVYMLSLWKVKEGEYPPPAERRTKNVLEPVVDYFRDCFSSSFYLWIFVGSLFFQLGNLGNGYQFFYMRYELHMDLHDTGWVTGIGLTTTIIFGMLLGYPAGAMIDRLKPIRVLPATLFIWGVLAFVSFFYVQDKISAAVMSSCIQVNSFVFGVAVGAITVELFPREKLGQFCSAQAFFYQTIILVVNPLGIAPFFDWLKFNRAGYIWSGSFYLLSGLIYMKVYFDWKKRQLQAEVPRLAESRQPLAS